MSIIFEIRRKVNEFKVNEFKYACYKINDIVKINENNDYSKLDEFNEAGIYIFFDKNKIPVYIGSAKSGLKNRIVMQLTPGKGNSSLNIVFIIKNVAIIVINNL